MKKHLSVWTMFLILSAALPMSADEEQKKDTILGQWYVQVGGTADDQLVFGPSFSMQINFDEDGLVHFLMKMEGEERDADTQKYEHDKKKATLTIYERDEEGEVNEEPAGVFHYSFVDDMLVFRFKEGDEDVRMELTRQPEGTERHKKMRQEQGETAGGAVQSARETARAMQSATQMRGLHQGAVTYANSFKNNYPSSLGEMLPGDYFTPEYVLTPWSETKVPEDIDDWTDAKKVEWVNKNTGFVYLLAGKKVTLNSELIGLFELPRSSDQKMVRVLYEDNHIESLAYAEADELIEKQTGHTLKQWMKSISPGSGEAPDDDEKAEDAE
jgi:hypothetical protein